MIENYNQKLWYILGIVMSGVVNNLNLFYMSRKKEFDCNIRIYVEFPLIITEEVLMDNESYGFEEEEEEE